jgi:hypothetical protein
MFPNQRPPGQQEEYQPGYSNNIGDINQTSQNNSNNNADNIIHNAAIAPAIEQLRRSRENLVGRTISVQDGNERQGADGRRGEFSQSQTAQQQQQLLVQQGRINTAAHTTEGQQWQQLGYMAPNLLPGNSTSVPGAVSVASGEVNPLLMLLMNHLGQQQQPSASGLVDTLQALLQSQEQPQQLQQHAGSLQQQPGSLQQMLLHILFGRQTTIQPQGYQLQHQQQPVNAQISQLASNNNSNDVSNVLAMAHLQASAQAPSVPNVAHHFQQVVQQLQQQQEQQRQQEQRAQLAALMGTMLQNQQPLSDPDTQMQGNFLNQVFHAQSSESPPTNSGNDLALTILHALSAQQGSAPTSPQRSPPSTNTMQPSALSALSSQQSSLLQMIAAISNQMPQLPTSDDQSPAIRTQVVNEVGASSVASSNRSSNKTKNRQKLSGVTAATGRASGNVRSDNIASSSRRKRKDPPDRIDMGRNIGRPANAFVDREPNGRARSLPTLLVMPSDLVELSPHQTLLRYQIEVFRAQEEDVSTHTRGRNKPVQLGQIGVRCRHCKVLPVSERLRGSVYFPRAVEGFYQAAQNMNSTHLQTGECQVMGDDLRQEFADLIASRATSTGAGRSYWAQQARDLGLQNTEDGIRFYLDAA